MTGERPSAPPDLDGLAAFTEEEDRDDALFFAGRDREIAAVERACALALERIRAGRTPGSATRLLQGAPGAGKTALLSELRRRWVGAPAEGGFPAWTGSGAVLPVVVHWSDLGSEEAVVRAVLKAVDAGLRASFRRMRSSDVQGSAGAGGWIRAGGRRGQSTAPPALSLAELAEAVASFHGGAWPGPVCLMVDEVQAAEPGRAHVLGRLHEGVPGLPVVPVLAGLGSSQDHLAGLDIGLSRLGIDAVYDVGALAPAEAREAVERMLATYRVDRTGETRGWPGWLADRSDCWPQHLHNGMRALARGLLEAGGRLASVDGRLVDALERDYRAKSCDRRLSPAMRQSRSLVGAVMAFLPEGGLPDDKVLNAISALARTDDAEWALPEGKTPSSFLDHLIHQGALQRRSGPDSLYGCPIPSFRDYLLDYGSRGLREAGPPPAPEGDGLPAPKPPRKH